MRTIRSSKRFRYHWESFESEGVELISRSHSPSSAKAKFAGGPPTEEDSGTAAFAAFGVVSNIFPWMQVNSHPRAGAAG